jgi:DNA-binding XRE family transcriptional regulator
MDHQELLVPNPGSNPWFTCQKAHLGSESTQCCQETSNVVVALLLHSIYATSMGRKPKSEEERVANRIEELRTLSGLTRQELAEQVGVHYQTIGYIERGEYSPSLVLALRIASVLEAKVEEIFWLDEEQE